LIKQVVEGPAFNPHEDSEEEYEQQLSVDQHTDSDEEMLAEQDAAAREQEEEANRSKRASFKGALQFNSPILQPSLHAHVPTNAGRIQKHL